MVQLQAFLYFLPADLSEAASTSILNHGCPCNSWMNLCPTAPVAPNIATLRFEDITYRFLCSFELTFFDKNINGRFARCDFNYVDTLLAEGTGNLCNTAWRVNKHRVTDLNHGYAFPVAYCLEALCAVKPIHDFIDVAVRGEDSDRSSS
jgi:hypothetical protein